MWHRRARSVHRPVSARAADQRTRILGALVEVVAEDGYLGAKIGAIAAGAGVSRATFYEMFASKEACLLEAHGERAAALLESARREIDGAGPDGALRAGLAVLVGLAQERQHEFMFLTHEAMLAGPRPLAARERLLNEIARLIDDAVGSRAGPDVPSRILVGAAARTLGISIRRGQRELTPLLEGLLGWSALYLGPPGNPRWRTLEGEPALIRAVSDAGYAPFAAPPSPRGRHALPAAIVRRTQHERILHASAAAIARKGYEHTTVADIVAAGRLSRDVFYSHLSSRSQALEQASRLFYQEAIATMAGVFFTGPDCWAERVWKAALALAELIAAAPSFTKVAFIDAYAPGRSAARHTDELLLAFTVFIERRAGESAHDTIVPTLVPVAVVAALAETVVALIASEKLAELPGLIALGCHLALAPYLGVRHATRFLEGKLRELHPET